MRIFYALCLSLTALVSTSSYAGLCAYPAVNQLEGEWLGVGDKGGSAHLILNNRGNGRLAVKEAHDEFPNSYYRITSVKLNGYILAFTLDPISWPPETELSGFFNCGYLTLDRLEVGSTRGSQRFNLQRKKLLVDSLESVQADPP